MTKEEFQGYIDTKREFEFPVDGTRYNITYGTDENDKPCIFVGPVFQVEQTFYSFGEMMAHCKIRNHFLREIIRGI